MFEIRQTAVFSAWLSKLRDGRAKAKIAARIDRLALGNPGDVKPVGHGVSEMRVDHGPGYRVYFVRRARIVIVLLCGGDKSSQAGDIKTAMSMASQLED
jgi:putative addiction module killer protein